MIKGVIFDLDQTLFDRYGTLEACAPLLYDSFKDYMAPGLGIEDVAVTMIYADKKYVYYGWKRILQYLIESGFFVKPMDFEYYSNAIKSAFRKEAVPFSYTYDVLRELRDNGFKVGLVTNGASELQMAKLNLLGLEKAFDEIITSDDVTMVKPHTEPFELMCQRLGCLPGELLYVGDNPINDIDASRRAGYIPVWVKTSGIWPFKDIKKPDYEIDTVEGIFDIIEKINRLSCE